MHVKNFYDLDAWKLARDIAIKIYRITQKFPPSEIYGLTSQMRRAAFFIGANIAEGFGRFHFKEKIRFFHISRGSLAELQNFLLIARDVQLITTETLNELFIDSEKEYMFINRLITSLQQCIK